MTTTRTIYDTPVPLDPVGLDPDTPLTPAQWLDEAQLKVSSVVVEDDHAGK